MFITIFFFSPQISQCIWIKIKDLKFQLHFLGGGINRFPSLSHLAANTWQAIMFNNDGLYIEISVSNIPGHGWVKRHFCFCFRSTPEWWMRLPPQIPGSSRFFITWASTSHPILLELYWLTGIECPLKKCVTACGGVETAFTTDWAGWFPVPRNFAWTSISSR